MQIVRSHLAFFRCLDVHSRLNISVTLSYSTVMVTNFSNKNFAVVGTGSSRSKTCYRGISLLQDLFSSLGMSAGNIVVNSEDALQKMAYRW